MAKEFVLLQFRAEVVTSKVANRYEKSNIGFHM